MPRMCLLVRSSNDFERMPERALRLLDSCVHLHKTSLANYESGHPAWFGKETGHAGAYLGM